MGRDNLRIWRARRAVLVIVALFCTVPASRAEEPSSLRNYLRQTWQTAEGLPQNSVRSIAQTREGYLWFATAEGLVRFDGVRFTVFDRTSTPALPSGNIDSLAVAADGALWIGFRMNGIGRLHAGQVTLWTKDQGLSTNEIDSIAITPDGSVWAATNSGLNRIRDGKVTVYRREQGLPDDHCYAVSVSARGLLVGTGAGAALVTGAGVVERIAQVQPQADGDGDAAAAAMVTAVVEAGAGDWWFGTTKGLLRLRDGGAREWFTMADGLPSDDVTALTRGRDGTIWIGLRSGGVARFNGDRGSRNHRDDRDDRDDRAKGARFDAFSGADGLPDDFVHVVYEDHEKNVWVGTNAGGVSRLHHTPFRTISKRDGLPADVIRAVFESQDGGMWVATHAHGLARVRNGTVTRWTVREGLPSDSVALIGQSRDGAMWIGTRSGLARIAPAAAAASVAASVAGAVAASAGSSAATSLKHYTTAEGLPHANVRGMFEDRDGALWIGTVGGVCRIEGARCVAIDGLKFNARGFHQSADGALWIAGNRGLFRYDRDGGTKQWTKRDGLSSDFLTSIAAEPDGTLWISTSGAGLNRFKDGRITSYTTAQGLYDDTIFRVLFDGRGWAWMTSNRGLFRVAHAELEAVAEGRERTVHSQAYTETDGLPSPEFNGGSFPAGVVARDGRLWLPSVKGVVIVDPARVEAAPPVPLAHVERAVVDGRQVALAGAATAGGITAGPGEGNLEFQYTAFQYVAPMRLRFRYKLDGFDSDWVDAGTRRTAYYTRVPPGQYVFRVEASNEAGVWGAAGLTAAIELKPRFYQTRWFVGCAVLAGGLLVWGAIRLRTARHRAQQRRLVAMVDARTRELQEEVAERTRAEHALVEAREAALAASRLKSEFLANMSHEIRTPMNGIIGMTELALDHPLDPKVQEYLRIVGASAHSLLDVINDILDFAKIEAGKLDLQQADFDLRELLNGLVALLGPQANQKGLAIRGDVAADVPGRLVGDAGRLRQVLTNLIGNALKFTDQGEIRIEVTNAASSDDTTNNAKVMLRFAVIDTGIGIAENDRARIFEAFTQVDGSATRRFGGTGLGLAISSQLVQLMGGRLHLESTVGRGSTFSFAATFGIAQTPRAAAPLPVYARAARPLAVLVAEDSPVNQLLVRRLLEKAGHHVTIVDNGVAAIEAVARGRFDAVLMDVQMPEMDGFDATSRIRAAENGGPRLPIIALTAHAIQGDRERCLAAGMDAYVSKPIRPELLFASLAEVTGSGSRDAA
jgi:signal transduction histidine kinase/ligand-binding sensor domain-containing protein/CheY-like chemotaxis protein